MRPLPCSRCSRRTVHAQERVGPLTPRSGGRIRHSPSSGSQAEASAEEVRREQVSVARADYLLRSSLASESTLERATFCAVASTP